MLEDELKLACLVAMVEACGPIYVPKMMDIWFLVILDRFSSSSLILTCNYQPSNSYKLIRIGSNLEINPKTVDQS